MASGPVGFGEVARTNPHGNAFLKTVGPGGGSVETALWLTSFSTGLSAQWNSAATRTRKRHRAVGMAERTLTFSCIIPLHKSGFKDWTKGFGTYHTLVSRLKDHWAFVMNEDTPVPMSLRYLGANKTWQGLITEISEGETRFQNTKSLDLSMALITSIADAEAARIVGRLEPYVPHRGDVADWGPQWYSISELEDEFAIPQDPKDQGNSSSSGPRGSQRR